MEPLFAFFLHFLLLFFDGLLRRLLSTRVEGPGGGLSCLEDLSLERLRLPEFLRSILGDLDRLRKNDREDLDLRGIIGGTLGMESSHESEPPMPTSGVFKVPPGDL
ncbi:hypothetical protein AVEN_261819-1 [Araneus ventricosus]|uniref:Uncharacterized protein n=1 Tax=Araneus ventricosus TaxID=182803 RepID=A0A4Y2LZ19_ARAVE|nr:hypothetical protein AVEN_261819-1 [Araneus ventricosus]